ncbi:2-hydroxyacid dehydrogenase [Liquorilactobacillus cacaonum]|uniref:Dehydrogenase n=1 Tax=Liquorilactobacillus cacaonum DSM 21116 TaxID=1423729 RepID=A0A0R2CNR4_9LACO|nr:C-terminal binding protein [Liquorilactobacillus cacaonum]KRM92642.1 dehydrogenase [Liquorilactobacillus cacaonum DSM 21116]
MKVLISDFKEIMQKNNNVEMKLLKRNHPDWRIAVQSYDLKNPKPFYDELKDADALITAFLPIDQRLLDEAPKLKLISISAVGYEKVNLQLVQKKGVRVCAIGEYCTQDVAEFTMSLIFALVKRLKQYDRLVNEEHRWEYDAFMAQPRLSKMTLGILGYGRIGSQVAKMANAFGMRVIAYSRHALVGTNCEGVDFVTEDEVFAKSDVVSNHMRATADNYHFFDAVTFNKMKQKKPYFINVSRGETVDEKALLFALNSGMIRGAALDVLESETPNLIDNPLLQKNNVLISPHAAFYSQDSMATLQRISCQNVISFFEGQEEKVFNFVD